MGTNGGSAYVRPSNVPSRSDTVLIDSTTYSDAGRIFSTTDPRGIESRYEHDELGRRITLIEAYVDGTPSDADDRITRWKFNGSSQILTMTADLPSGQSDQTTSYNYNARTSRGDDFNANNALVVTSYPSVGIGIANTEEFELNRAGQRTEWRDRNGTAHEYEHDLLGRVTSDLVTALGSGVDGTVRELTTGYDDAGRIHLLTSKDGSGAVLNQIERLYNGLGQLTEEFQEHDGVVDAFTPSVQYAYSEMASGANHSRLTGMTYPDGRVLVYAYISGLDSTISRLSKLTWDATDVETYSYLGLSTTVVRERPEAEHALTYVKQSGESNGDAGDQYTGLDRFGRIIDQRWGGMRNVIVGEVEEWQWVNLDRFAYGHDRNGNRLYEENLLDTGKSELYHAGGGYDALNRLGEFSRGTLNGTKDGLTGSASRSQEWSLDALGNWDSVTDETSTTQTRTHDSQNRITGVSGATTPEHSANGEMTRDETGNYLVYDAWGRLVEVNDGSAVISAYAYDALTRRIAHYDTGLYYSNQWQVLEERDDSTGAVEGQYVWSPVYIDAMVLRDRDTGPNTAGLEERLYVTHDATFNVTSIIGLDGSTWEVVERYVYDPYGERTVLNADWTVDTDGLSDFAFVHGHQGGRHDLAVGLVDFRNRFLDTSLGRWTRQDPLEYIDGGSQYTNRLESPLRYTDALGLTIKIDDPSSDGAFFLGILQSLCPSVTFGVGGGGIVVRVGGKSCDPQCVSAGTGAPGVIIPGSYLDGTTPQLCACICNAIEDGRTFTLYKNNFPPALPTRPAGPGHIAGTLPGCEDVYLDGIDRPVPGVYPGGAGGTRPPGVPPGSVTGDQRIILAHELCIHAFAGTKHPPVGHPDRYTPRDPVTKHENRLRKELGAGYGQRTF